MAVFHRNARIESAPFDTESILFNPDTKQFVKLNRANAIIWDRIGGGATTDEIAAALCDYFQGVQPEQAKQDAGEALDEMLRLGLVNQM